MATEPLGGRILWAATNWEAIRAEDGVMAGREEYEDLRALCARADAAERLAVAGDVYWGAMEAYDTSENEDDWDELLAGMKSRRAQLDEALAAWRALGEVDGA
jgi:hypothetical protein